MLTQNLKLNFVPDKFPFQRVALIVPAAERTNRMSPNVRSEVTLVGAAPVHGLKFPRREEIDNHAELADRSYGGLNFDYGI